jgi:CheY-like chemotaxis protein
VKVLVIDDNPDFAESMRALLQIHGYDVRCYFSGQDFLRQVQTVTDDDIIITDYYLPDLNGIELVKRARAERPRVAAILLTGSREMGIAKAAREVADCRVEYKPLDYESLERSIRQLSSARKKEARL